MVAMYKEKMHEFLDVTKQSRTPTLKKIALKREDLDSFEIPRTASETADIITITTQIVNRTAKRNMSGIITIVTAYDKFCKWRKVATATLEA